MEATVLSIPIDINTGPGTGSPQFPVLESQSYAILCTLTNYAPPPTPRIAPCGEIRGLKISSSSPNAVIDSNFLLLSATGLVV